MLKFTIFLALLTILIGSCRREDKKYNLIRNLKDSRFEAVSYEAKFYYPGDSTRFFSEIQNGSFSVGESSISTLVFEFIDSNGIEKCYGTVLSECALKDQNKNQHEMRVSLEYAEGKYRQAYFILNYNKFELLKPFSEDDIFMHTKVKTTEETNQFGPYPQNLDSVVETFVFKKLN